MLTPFILVCLLSTARIECNTATAVGVYQVPPHSAGPSEPPEPPTNTPFACIQRAQEWAGTNVQVDPETQWVKVYCVPPQKLPGNVG